MMKKKKGFTLIEIMATIIILGIIALVSIPSANSSIEKSKKRLAKSSAHSLAQSVESQCRNEQLDGEDITKVYTIEDGKISKNIDAKNLPDRGTVTTGDNCEVDLAVEKNGYCVIMKGDQVTLKSNTYNCEIEYKNILETKQSCFIFDEATRTIIGYNYADTTCPTDISIPATINNIPVEHIGDYAFLSETPDYVISRQHKSDLSDTYENVASEYYYDDIIDNFNNKNYYMYYMMPIKKINNDMVKYCYKSLPYGQRAEKPLDYVITSGDGFAACDFLYANTTTNVNYKEGTDYIIVGGNITSVDFSKAINLVSIGNNAFFHNKISSLYFESLPNLIKIGVGAFSQNNISNKLDLSGLTGMNEISNDSFSYNNISKIIFSDKILSIGNFAFHHNKIEEINLPKNLEKIKSQAFASNLISSLNIPNKVKFISGFENNNITSLNIPSNVKAIGGSSFGVNNMSTLTLNEGQEYIGDYAFSDNKLTSITIPNTVTYLSGFAYNDIKSLIIPNNVTKIGECAFCMNGKLYTVAMGDKVETIDDNAFHTCHIRNMTWGTHLKTIGNYSFEREEWNSLIIPEGVETIGNHGFWNNYVMSNLTIPSSVKTIESQAFEWSRLGTVTIKSGKTSIGSNCFAGNVAYSVTINVNGNYADSYKTSAPWGNCNTTINWTDKTIKYESGKEVS